jgi:hypothetical protein
MSVIVNTWRTSFGIAGEASFFKAAVLEYTRWSSGAPAGGIGEKGDVKSWWIKKR